MDAQSRINAIAEDSDSLVDFTKLALHAYDLHRRLDKLMAASFIEVVNDEGDTERSVHEWKRRCYKVLGVDSSVAVQLLSVDGQSSHGADAV